MAERKAQPAAKKTAAAKAISTTVAKPKTAKAALVVTPIKTAAKKTATAKPRTTKTPAAKKAVMPTAQKVAAAQKSVTAKIKPNTKKAVAQPTSEERYRMVQTAAYFIAERNGFCGCPSDHWMAAELEIANRLGV